MQIVWWSGSLFYIQFSIQAQQITFIFTTKDITNDLQQVLYRHFRIYNQFIKLFTVSTTGLRNYSAIKTGFCSSERLNCDLGVIYVLHSTVFFV